MTGRVFEFPSGKEMGGEVSTVWRAPKWSVMSALVRLVGVRQQPVVEYDGVVTQSPVFFVELHSFGDTEKVACMFDVTGVENLHPMLHLLIDGAHQRGDGFSITDYTRGVAQLPEEYAIENQS